jgi:glycosyltransferase involved in cell wall biosynthesis
MRSGRKVLLLIDSATSGVAGAYIDGIWRRLAHRDAVEVAVSYYFPFDYGKRIFFKYSELTAQRVYRLGRARLYVRFGELLIAFARLIAWVIVSRVKVVCYALSSNLSVEYAFLWFLKHVARVDVLLICHDVVPFVGPGQELADMIRRRQPFYRLADGLIVHNEHSIEHLHSVFGIAPGKVRQFPFPIYDTSAMGFRDIDVWGVTGTRRFLFIGHLRQEKGVGVLLDAWARLRQRRQDAELVIAGNIPAGCEYDLTAPQERGIRLLAGYVTDEDYVNLIRHADCVVLPYSRGTNSAVVSTVLAAGTHLVVSDIPMFKNNPLIPPESFFACDDAESLAERLAYVCDLGPEQRRRLELERDRRLPEYEAAFQAQVNAVLDPAALGAR